MIYDKDASICHTLEKEDILTHGFNYYMKKKIKFSFNFQAGAKGVVCYYDKTKVQLKSFQTPKDMRPVLQKIPANYTLEAAYKTDKDSVICKFSRSITVPMGSEDLMYDLNSPLYTLKAYGPYDDVNTKIGYHGFPGAGASISSNPIQIVPVLKPVSCALGMIFWNKVQTWKSIYEF